MLNGVLVTMKLNDTTGILWWLSPPRSFLCDTGHALPLSSSYSENSSKLVTLLWYKSGFSETKLFPEFIVDKRGRKLFFQQNDFVPAENECTVATGDSEEGFRVSLIETTLFIISYRQAGKRSTSSLLVFSYYIL